MANHAAAIPSDAPVIMHGIETELDRPVYGLADNFFRTVPVVGTLWSRLGGLPAHPDNAYRLLSGRGQLVLVFPEGSKGPGKLYSERYQLRRFGRGGFVEIAMRAGVPVVPIAVMGAEESMPTARIAQPGQTAGPPVLPGHRQHAALGPLGVGVYFPAKFKLRVLDPVHFDVPLRPGALLRSRSWTSPRPSVSASRTRSTTCSATGGRCWSDGRGRPGGHARVLVTGLGTFWGGRVAQALETDPRSR